MRLQPEIKTDVNFYLLSAILQQSEYVYPYWYFLSSIITQMLIIDDLCIDLF